MPKPVEKPELNQDTLEWRGVKLRDCSKKTLIDIIVHLFASNLALQMENKKIKEVGNIIVKPS